MALAVPGAAVEETDMRGCYTGDGVKIPQLMVCAGLVWGMKTSGTQASCSLFKFYWTVSVHDQQQTASETR
jgi:hypothetical protein